MSILKVFLFTIFLVALGCVNEIEIKPMNYERHGKHLSCDGYYEQSLLQKVVCFTPARDTILIEDYENGMRNGSSVLYYPTGIICESGHFLNGKEHGVWKEFYENEVLKSYRFYEVKNDTSYLVYEKEFGQDGSLFSLRYPLRFRTSSTGDYFVGKSYGLYVDLSYSEFDSVASYGFIEPAPSSSVPRDTLVFEGRSLFLEFTPKSKGVHKISGSYIEVDASEANPDEGYGGEKDWVFQYEAVDER